jgi:TonB family protein
VKRFVITACGLAVAIVASTLVAWWWSAGRMNTADLRELLPDITPPPVGAVAYEGPVILRQIQGCFAPFFDLEFQATATEYGKYLRRPTLQFEIGTRGTVDGARMLLSSGNVDLDRRLLAWFRGLRFPPSDGCELRWRGRVVVAVRPGPAA